MSKNSSSIMFLAAIPIVLVFCGGWAALFNWLFDNSELGAIFGLAHLTVLGLSTTTEMLKEEIVKNKTAD
jgi:hypothetical protein